MDESFLQEMLKKKRRFDAQLEAFQQRSFAEANHTSSGEVAAVYDLYMLDDVMYLDLELPGALENEISIRIMPPYLVIEGSIHPLEEIKPETYLVRGRSYGAFRHTFATPPEQIIHEYQSRFVSGVLHLKLKLAARHQQSLLDLPQA